MADSERAADGLRDRITVRGEMLSDADVVRRLVTEAFEGPAEADIVRRLRGQPGVFSFVAEVGGAVAGHVVFSPGTLRGRGPSLVGAALGPVAVAPAHQRKGIGGMLIRRGLAQCLEDGVPFVAVVGEPEYYARLGFQPASRWHVQVEYDMPEEHFMLQVLVAGLMVGTVHYHPAFSEEES